MKKILSFLFLIPTLVMASEPCNDLAAKKILVIQLGSKSELIACGESTKGPVSDLTILHISDGKTEKLFEGDAAMKIYEVRQNEKAISIMESTNSKGSKPFLESRFFCEKNKCQTTSTCIWKRDKPDDLIVQKIQKVLKKKNTDVSDTDAEKLFYSALNGSTKAIKLLSVSIENKNASGSESLETYKADVDRLKKSGCL